MLNHQRGLTLPRPTAAPTATQLRACFNTPHLLLLCSALFSVTGPKGCRLLYPVQQGTSALSKRRRQARASLIPSLCTRFTRAGIEWRR